MISSVLHFYSISYFELLELPIYMFWELAKNIDRLKAEDNLSMFALLSNLLSDNPKEYIGKMEKVRGDIVVVDNEEIDKEGLTRLKLLLGNTSGF